MPIKDCEGCPSSRFNTGYAFGEGPTTSPIMVIGEALGEQEAIEGRPFVGGTGKMLRMMLNQAGIDPRTCYITNTVKCRPAANRKPTHDEVNNCAGRYLLKELLHVKPRVVVAVGDTAFKYLLPSSPIGVTTARGYTFRSPFGTVVPIVHPSFVARGNPQYWAVTVADLIKVRHIAQGTLPEQPKEQFIISPTIDQVEEAFQTIHRNKLRFSFDIETIGERDKLNIMCIGLGWSPSHAICIPFLRRGGHEYWRSNNEETHAWRRLCQLFSSDIESVGQNVFTFDIPKLAELGVVFRRYNALGNTRIHDTLIRHHNLATELPHSLEFLTSVYTNMPHYKGVKVNIWADDIELWTYNARDCVATWIADREITQELKELGLA